MASSLAAAKRLRKELQVLRRDQSDDDDTIQLQHNPDNLLCWKALIRGPADTPYEGGVFQLDIRCGVDYPLAPPKIKFETKVSRLALVLQPYFIPSNMTFADISPKRSFPQRRYLFGYSKEGVVAGLGFGLGVSGGVGPLVGSGRHLTPELRCR